MANINRVVLVGNLTRDPELRHTPSGTAVCKLRIAVNTRMKDGATGQWTDKPNYFDVTVWGNQGESCAQYLSKGRPVAIDGRLDWREWDAQDGTKRQAVEIIADSVQFLGTAAPRARASSCPPAPRRGERRLHAGRDRRRHPVLMPPTSRDKRDSSRARPRRQGRPRRCPDPAPQLLLLPREDRRGRLQERGAAAAVHLREGQDPLAAHHRRVPPPPAAARGRDQAGARDGAPALRVRLAMEVILLTDVDKLGLRGDVVDVARGYARNYLLPRRMAEVATPAKVAELARREAQRARHEASTGDQARRSATKLEALELRFDVNAGPTGHALRLGHADGHRRRIWREAQDPRRPAQDPAARLDQAHRPLRDRDRDLRGRDRRACARSSCPRAASCRPRSRRRQRLPRRRRPTGRPRPRRRSTTRGAPRSRPTRSRGAGRARPRRPACPRPSPPTRGRRGRAGTLGQTGEPESAVALRPRARSSGRARTMNPSQDRAGSETRSRHARVTAS